MPKTIKVTYPKETTKITGDVWFAAGTISEKLKDKAKIKGSILDESGITEKLAGETLHETVKKKKGKYTVYRWLILFKGALDDGTYQLKISGDDDTKAFTQKVKV